MPPERDVRGGRRPGLERMGNGANVRSTTHRPHSLDFPPAKRKFWGRTPGTDTLNDRAKEEYTTQLYECGDSPLACSPPRASRGGSVAVRERGAKGRSRGLQAPRGAVTLL